VVPVRPGTQARATDLALPDDFSCQLHQGHDHWLKTSLSRIMLLPMRRRLAALLTCLPIALGACSSGAGDCDELWTELQAARDAAQTYTIQRVQGLSNREIENLPEDPEENRLHAEVDRKYAAWQAAGCDQ
jgi:hypothetical protein